MAQTIADDTTRATGHEFLAESDINGSPYREIWNMEAESVLYACLSRGLSYKIAGGNVISLSPPLTVDASEIEQALAIIETSLKAGERKHDPI